jgi:hypothetical protein
MPASNIDDRSKWPASTGRDFMFRKVTLALAAAAVMTAITPTAASAYWSGWHHHDYHHGYYRPGVVVRVGVPAYAYAPRCFTTKRWVYGYRGWHPVFVRHCR